MMTQKLIIIRGNSGSGKSTVAKRLRERIGYETMLIPQDVVRREILRVADETRNPAIDLIYNLAQYGKKIGYSVIIEGILSVGKYGDMIQRLIKDLNLDTRVYYFDISFEETLKRHANKTISAEYGEAEMREWWKEKDYLKVEGEKLITDNMKEDEIVEMIYKDIT